MRPNQKKGRIKIWKDDKGFGFIQPDEEEKDVFLHISALPKGSRRPKAGDTILYEQITEPSGKIRAVKASILGASLQSAGNQTSKSKQQMKPKTLWNTIITLLGGTGLAILASNQAFNSFNQVSNSPNQSSNSSSVRPECNIKGNISMNTGRKLYHVPGMEDYESTRIDQSAGERWFCTENEAIASGWTKAPR